MLGGGLMSATTGNKWEWHLGGKVKEGDTVFYRLRGQDDLPGDLGGPHVTYYPGRRWFSANEDRWLKLQIVKEPEGLKEKLIADRQKQINDRLEKIKSDLKAEKRSVYKEQAATQGQLDLDPERRDAINDVVKDNRSIEKALRNLVPDAMSIPNLERLAEVAQDVADNQMRESEKALKNAATDRLATKDRREQFDTADKQLDSALKALDMLKTENDRLSKEQLRHGQGRSVSPTNSSRSPIAPPNWPPRIPTRDPEVKKDADKLAKEQKETEAELQKLADSSDALKKAPGRSPRRASS